MSEVEPQAVFKTRRGPRKPGRPQFLHGSASIILIFTSQFEPAPTAHAMVYDAQPEIAETSVAARGYSGVNLYGPVGVVSGVGSASRGYLGALRAAAVPVCVVPVHEVFVHQPSVGSSEYRQWPRHPISLVHVNADSVHRFLHYHARSFSRARYKIGIWVWELPALRDEWWSEFRHFDEIWVPSTFCQRAVQAMTTKPVIGDAACRVG